MIEPVYLIFINLEKAYDTVPQNEMVEVQAILKMYNKYIKH